MLGLSLFKKKELRPRDLKETVQNVVKDAKADVAKATVPRTTKQPQKLTPLALSVAEKAPGQTASPRKSARSQASARSGIAKKPKDLFQEIIDSKIIAAIKAGATEIFIPPEDSKEEEIKLIYAALEKKHVQKAFFAALANSNVKKLYFSHIPKSSTKLIPALNANIKLPKKKTKSKAEDRESKLATKEGLRITHLSITDSYLTREQVRYLIENAPDDVIYFDFSRNNITFDGCKPAEIEAWKNLLRIKHNISLILDGNPLRREDTDNSADAVVFELCASNARHSNGTLSLKHCFANYKLEATLMRKIFSFLGQKDLQKTTNLATIEFTDFPNFPLSRLIDMYFQFGGTAVQVKIYNQEGDPILANRAGALITKFGPELACQPDEKTLQTAAQAIAKLIADFKKIRQQWYFEIVGFLSARLSEEQSKAWAANQTSNNKIRGPRPAENALAVLEGFKRKFKKKLISSDSLIKNIIIPIQELLESIKPQTEVEMMTDANRKTKDAIRRYGVPAETDYFPGTTMNIINATETVAAMVQWLAVVTGETEERVLENPLTLNFRAARLPGRLKFPKVLAEAKSHKSPEARAETQLNYHTIMTLSRLQLTITQLRHHPATVALCRYDVFNAALSKLQTATAFPDAYAALKAIQAAKYNKDHALEFVFRSMVNICVNSCEYHAAKKSISLSGVSYDQVVIAPMAESEQEEIFEVEDKEAEIEVSQSINQSVSETIIDGERETEQPQEAKKSANPDAKQINTMPTKVDTEGPSSPSASAMVALLPRTALPAPQEQHPASSAPPAPVALKFPQLATGQSKRITLTPLADPPASPLNRRLPLGSPPAVEPPNRAPGLPALVS